MMFRPPLPHGRRDQCQHQHSNKRHNTDWPRMMFRPPLPHGRGRCQHQHSNKRHNTDWPRMMFRPSLPHGRRDQLSASTQQQEKQYGLASDDVQALTATREEGPMSASTQQQEKQYGLASDDVQGAVLLT